MTAVCILENRELKTHSSPTRPFPTILLQKFMRRPNLNKRRLCSFKVILYLCDRGAKVRNGIRQKRSALRHPGVFVQAAVAALFPAPGSRGEWQRWLVLVIAFYYHAITQANTILHANIWHQYDLTDP